jgi:hypothetical protein
MEKYLADIGVIMASILIIFYMAWDKMFPGE